jgi:hypothetical protein
VAVAPGKKKSLISTPAEWRDGGSSESDFILGFYSALGALL